MVKTTLRVGDLVVKHPTGWRKSEFDQWGAGRGVGIVVDVIPSDDADNLDIDVQWPTGRAYQRSREVFKVDPDRLRNGMMFQFYVPSSKQDNRSRKTSKTSK